METKVQNLPGSAPGTKKFGLLRPISYMTGKVFTLFLMVIMSVLLVILIGNFGGYIDEMVKGEIALSVGLNSRYMFQDLPYAERMDKINDMLEAHYDAAGLNDPFILRTFRWLWMAVRLDLGHPISGSPFLPFLETKVTVRQLLAQYLPFTIGLFGTVNLVVFFSSIAVGLISSNKYNSRFDRFLQNATLLSTIPPWFYGVVLGTIVVMLGLNPIYWLLVFISLFVGLFFQSASSWRTYFLLYEGEDYVEFAKAQGLPRRLLRRKTIIRPSLPTILTNFSLSMVSAWMGSIVLEVIFGWQGIGYLFYMATWSHDTSILVGIVVVYAYLLAITIFLLDIAYFLVDPRLRVGSKNRRKNISNTGPFRRKRDRISIHGRFDPRSLLQNLTGFFHPVRKLRTIRTSLRKIGDLIKGLAQDRRMKWSMVSVASLFLLALLVAIFIPYKEAIALWRGDDNLFIYYPKSAPPEWTNWFREEKLPPSIILNSENGEAEKIVELTSETNKVVTITFPIDYPYSAIPEDTNLYVDAEYQEKQPLYMLYWQTPDGDRERIADFTNAPQFRYSLTTSDEVKRNLGSENVEEALFLDPDDPTKVRQGSYTLVMESFLFEPDADVEAELVIRGKVYGLAGTDDHRRNLMIVFLWGLPIVLAFGLFGAVMTNLLTMLIGAVSSWYGGWLDNLIQRITEINMAIPAFPISLMIFSMYSKSIWTILLVTIALNIFGSGIKTYRSTFLQVKESLYIESAIAYGAKDGRIIYRYLMPRIISILVPNIIVAVPGFVFLETSLAFLGLSDPVFPTWGKLFVSNLFLLRGTTFSFSPENMCGNTVAALVLPTVMLILLTVSFNNLGKGLEKMLNPRLRDK